MGMGPRGLSALEHFIIAFSRNRYSPLRILLFEPAKYPGAGKIWDLDQSACNWANIPERRLKELKERPEINFPEFNIPHFPSYLDWLPSNQHLKDGNRPDKYPQRKLLGQYLHERFISMSSILIQQNIIQLITKTIVNVDFEEPYFKLTDEDQNSYQCQEVLLTIGHQPTQNSKQLKRWSNFSKSKDSITLFENAIH